MSMSVSVRHSESRTLWYVVDEAGDPVSSHESEELAKWAADHENRWEEAVRREWREAVERHRTGRWPLSPGNERGKGLATIMERVRLRGPRTLVRTCCDVCGGGGILVDNVVLGILTRSVTWPWATLQGKMVERRGDGKLVCDDCSIV